ncbi:MAG: class I tRNA ligase family protein, partial [Pseudomonadota bacterium]
AGYRNFGTKLWNAVRFAEMNGVYGPDTPAYECHTDGIREAYATQTANKWIIGETARVREEVDAALAAFRFNDAAGALYAYVWGRVCDWYVEFAKPLFASEDPDIVRETRATMRWVLDQCLILLHPMMPFITEELWTLTAPAGGRPKMLVHADWPTYQATDLEDKTADREMNWVINLIEGIRSVRAQMHVPVGLRLPLLQMQLDEAGQAALARNAALIQRLARVESFSETSDLPKGAVSIPVEGGMFALPLADAIDIGEERERLEKALGKLEKDLNGLRGRLNNANFVASAPEDVVVETRERLAQGEDEAQKVRAVLDRLAEMA